MKRIFITLLFLLPLAVMAQLTFELNGVANRRISSELPEGAKIKLTKIRAGGPGVSSSAILNIGDKEYDVSLSDLKRVSFIPENIKQFWQHQALQNDVYENIGLKGLQFKLRKELEEEAIEYLGYLESNNLLFNDSYLESYLYSLAFRIYPVRLEDGRPGILNIKVLKDNVPNAFIFPNGTLLVSSGLLSTINSEDELIGILAHEIAHYVLDHSVININAEKERQQRAEFWAAVATGLAAAADVYMGSRNYYYTPGTLTMNTAILAYSIAATVNQRLGLAFSREQEKKADECAVELMKFINVDPRSLSSALLKIKEFVVLSGNYHALSGEGTHPAIDERIGTIGNPTKSFNDPKYDQRISFVNSFNAILSFNNKNFEASANLIKRNIEAKVAVEEDYVLLAAVTMHMFDTPEKNQEALDLLTRAKTLNVFPTINLQKQEAIALIRLRRHEEAKKSLETYKDAVNNQLQLLNNSNGLAYNYYYDEFEWASKMIHKVTLL